MSVAPTPKSQYHQNSEPLALLEMPVAAPQLSSVSREASCAPAPLKG